MDRDNCGNSHYLGGEVFCGYYDFGYYRCSEVVECPEGLDEDCCEDCFEEDNREYLVK